MLKIIFLKIKKQKTEVLAKDISYFTNRAIKNLILHHLFFAEEVHTKE